MTERTEVRTLLALALLCVGCGHAKEAEIAQTFEPPPTIGYSFTADLARLQENAPGAGNGIGALVALVKAQLATVGQLRPDQPAAAGAPVDVVADLPAPGFALRVHIAPKPELMALVRIEPVATDPHDHPVTAAPWSVHAAYDEVCPRIAALRPPRLPPMDAARFARLRAEATEAAKAERDPLLTPNEYVRVPRPITSEGEDAPYYTPPAEPSTLQPGP